MVFGFGADKQEKAFRQQMGLQQEAQEMQYAAQSIPASVSEDPQVSWRLLDNDNLFLAYGYDSEKRRAYKLQKDRDLIEPAGSEPLAFLMEQKQDRELLLDMDSVLSAIYNYMEKYGREPEAVRLFNTIARVRLNFLNSSRATGKAGKLAKSQFVESDSRITRTQAPKQGKDKFMGGLLG